MPASDLKITALTAIGANPVNPATFPIPMVDLLDTSMAASGTTKKVTVNQILQAGGTATLASATITGALTAGGNVGFGTTNLTTISGYTTLKINNATNGAILDLAQGDAYKGRVIGSTNGLILESSGILPIQLQVGGLNSLKIDPLGVFTWYDGASGTRMTLNSTGLGIGRSPSYRFQASSGTKATTASIATVGGITTTDADDFGIYFRLKTDATGANRFAAITAFDNGSGNGARDLVLQDLGGNVGIGVTPSAWDSTFKAIQINNRGAYISATSNSFSTAPFVQIGNNGYYDTTNSRWEYVTGNAAAQYVQAANSHLWYIAAIGSADAEITDFATAKMTLDASGRLLVGQTSTGMLNLNGIDIEGGDSNGGSYIIVNHKLATVAGQQYAFFAYNAVKTGDITQNGTTGVLYNTVSDYRLKESVKPISNGLDRVNSLKPSSYNWKSDGSVGEGFIAHELAEVVPTAVSGEKDAMNEDGSIKSQGIDMSRVVPILVAAIQELTARVQTLEAR